MKALSVVTRENVYNAPTIPWDNDTYTPVSNKFIMDTIELMIRALGLSIRSESYQATVTMDNIIKGVIGSYNIATSDSDFGQKIMFRNSYDKSMSFAFVVGTVVWVN